MLCCLCFVHAHNISICNILQILYACKKSRWILSHSVMFTTLSLTAHVSQVVAICENNIAWAEFYIFGGSCPFAVCKCIGSCFMFAVQKAVEANLLPFTLSSFTTLALHQCGFKISVHGISMVMSWVFFLKLCSHINCFSPNEFVLHRMCVSSSNRLMCDWFKQKPLQLHWCDHLRLPVWISALTSAKTCKSTPLHPIVLVWPSH